MRLYLNIDRSYVHWHNLLSLVERDCANKLRNVCGTSLLSMVISVMYDLCPAIYKCSWSDQSEHKITCTDSTVSLLFSVCIHIGATARLCYLLTFVLFESITLVWLSLLSKHLLSNLPLLRHYSHVYMCVHIHACVYVYTCRVYFRGQREICPPLESGWAHLPSNSVHPLLTSCCHYYSIVCVHKMIHCQTVLMFTLGCPPSSCSMHYLPDIHTLHICHLRVNYWNKLSMCVCIICYTYCTGPGIYGSKQINRVRGCSLRTRLLCNITMDP